MGENTSRLIELLELDKCDKCKRRDFSNCATKEDAAAWVLNEETGEKKYFCCIACALLYTLNEEGEDVVKSIIVDQFNREGEQRQMLVYMRHCDYLKSKADSAG